MLVQSYQIHLRRKEKERKLLEILFSSFFLFHSKKHAEASLMFFSVSLRNSPDAKAA